MGVSDRRFTEEQVEKGARHAYEVMVGPARVEWPDLPGEQREAAMDHARAVLESVDLVPRGSVDWDAVQRQGDDPLGGRSMDRVLADARRTEEVIEAVGLQERLSNAEDRAQRAEAALSEADARADEMHGKAMGLNVDLGRAREALRRIVDGETSTPRDGLIYIASVALSHLEGDTE